MKYIKYSFLTIAILAVFSGAYGFWYMSNVSSPDFYDDKLAGMIEEKRSEMNSTLFIGSSSFTMWSSLEEDLAQCGAVNFGFGGSQLVHIRRNIHDILSEHPVMSVVLYSGDNDIAVADKGHNEVLSEYMMLIDELTNRYEHLNVYVLSVKPSPRRMKYWETAVKVNDGLIEMSKYSDRVHYIDIATSMLQNKTTPKANLYSFDKIHMNDEGRKIWISKITESMECSQEHS